MAFLISSINIFTFVKCKEGLNIEHYSAFTPDLLDQARKIFTRIRAVADPALFVAETE